jgi:hypothetical protein
VASGSTVTINCTSAAWASGNFTLNVTAGAGATGCTNSFMRSVEVTRITPPVAKVVGTPSVTVCARPGSTALTYTVFSSTGSSDVSVTASEGVTCTPDKSLTGERSEGDWELSPRPVDPSSALA